MSTSTNFFYKFDILIFILYLFFSITTIIIEFIAPWLILGAVYRHIGETLQLLWNSDVHNNTVHVSDVCRAIWHVSQSNQINSGEIFNVSDNADTTFGHLARITADLFEIKYSFVGKMLSTLAKVISLACIRILIQANWIN